MVEMVNYIIGWVCMDFVVFSCGLIGWCIDFFIEICGFGVGYVVFDGYWLWVGEIWVCYIGFLVLDWVGVIILFVLL